MSEGDAWSAPDSGGAPGSAAYAAYPAMPKQPRDPDYVIWLSASVLFLVAGLLQAIMLLVHGHQITGTLEPLYDSVGFDVDFGVKALFMIACGVLLLNRRTREWAGGFAVGFGLFTLADYFWRLRPAELKSDFVTLGSWLYVAVYALGAAASVVALVALLRRRRTVGDARSRAERRVDRLVVVVLVFVAAVLWMVGTSLAWNRIGVGTGSGGIQHTEECCSWSQDNGWKQTAIVVGAITALALALFAATLNSKLRSTGVLFGIVAAGLPSVVSSVLTAIAPLPTAYGVHYRDFIPADTRIVVTVTTGFWTGVAALLLLCAAAVSRLALGARKAAYPQNELERIAS